MGGNNLGSISKVGELYLQLVVQLWPKRKIVDKNDTTGEKKRDH